jgi:16S rRNA G966 N2-methylase RsmD
MPDNDVTLPKQGEITPVGWSPPGQMTQTDWLEFGCRLVKVNEATQWVLGDWWAFGAERDYGDGEAIAEALGVDYGTLRNAGRVSRAFELSRRRDNLLYSHHVEVARREDADDWLDRAEAGDVDPMTGEVTVWSRNRLRAAIKEHDRALRDAARADQAGGSCTIQQCSSEDLLGTLDDRSVDLILTDPPYDTDVDDIEEFAGWVRLAVAKVKPTGRLVIFHGRYPPEVSAYLRQADLTGWDHELCVWHYPDTLGPNPKGRFKTTHQMALVIHGPEAPDLYSDSLVDKQSCWAVAMNQEAVRYFSWQKPQKLAELLVSTCSPPGGFIVDCFAGAGTFLVAAAALGRTAIGCDLDADRIQDAAARGVEVV